MASATPKKKSEGTVLIDFALAMPLIASALIVASGSLALLLAHQLLFADAFALARAHLYGEAREFCAPSAQWPALPSLRLQSECNGQGSVRQTLQWRQREVFVVDLKLGVHP